MFDCSIRLFVDGSAGAGEWSGVRSGVGGIWSGDLLRLTWFMPVERSSMVEEAAFARSVSLSSSSDSSSDSELYGSGGSSSSSEWCSSLISWSSASSSSAFVSSLSTSVPVSKQS